jgi:hypothetical protein
MSLLVIPNVLVNGTGPANIVDAVGLNANFTATATALNNIYPSQIIPTTTAQATFGGLQPYLFLAPAVGTTPLTVSGITSQTADIFDVTLTSGGAKALSVTSGGSMITAVSATTAFILMGNGTTAQQAQLGLTANVFRISPNSSVSNIDFAVSTNGAVSNNLLFCSAVSISAPSLPGGAGTGDTITQRSITTGRYLMGGSSKYGFVDYNIVNASGISFQNESGYAQCFGTSFTNSSDANLKKNIQTLAYGSDHIISLKPVSFDWKHDGTPSLGFLAQDVQSVLPELVTADADGTLGVNYAGIIPVLVQAFQQQKAEFDAYVAAHP